MDFDDRFWAGIKGRISAVLLAADVENSAIATKKVRS
jgi:hypothetical protein